jgi:prepilin-type N-terminal cleavage/methylation domain-containing protein
MTNLKPITRRPARGFSLIELLVVIAIIAVIAGLIMSGVAALKSGAEESKARATLASLMGLAGQMETQLSIGSGLQHLQGVDKTYDWGDTGNNKRKNAQNATGSGDLNDGTGHDPAGDDNDYTGGDGTYTSADNDRDMRIANLYIERFLWAANQMPAIREKLPSLSGSFGDADDDDFLDLVDPWGNPIAYANYVQHPPKPNALNGTTNYPEDDFLPAHNGPFFASAGKDQRWGRPRVRGEFNTENDWLNYQATDEYEFSVDNLYSFDIDRSAAQRGD